jgi:hypothetical protein
MESPSRKRQILVEVDDDEYWWYTSVRPSNSEELGTL